MRFRKNSRVKETSQFFRKLSVIAHRNDFNRWKSSISYGKRWTAETAISTMKRMFGEYVYSVRYKNMVNEIILKAALYNIFTSII